MNQWLNWAGWRLPSTATAPFCPAEVQGSVDLTVQPTAWARMSRMLGPAVLVAVGYMDPGNWATAIEAGSRFGFDLLFVVLLSSLSAMLLQGLAARIGIASGCDLAQLCRQHFSPRLRCLLWILAELSIVATDVAEVLGSALALHLLLGVSLPAGVALTVLDTLLVLGLKGRGVRSLEAMVLALVVTIGLCFVAQLILVGFPTSALVQGMWPRLQVLAQPGAVPLAIALVGATVMPHNLYLHSSLVLSRRVAPNIAARRSALRTAHADTVLSLCAAMAVNVAILALAATVFHSRSLEVTDIADAHRLLAPILGTTLAPLLFALALLASGQSATLTGTIAGQVVLDGFMQVRIPCWQRRMITRGLALLPALAGLTIWGEAGVGRMLVGSQLLLSLQLPFAMVPLITFAASKQLMRELKAPGHLIALAWLICGLIVLGNFWGLYLLCIGG